MNMTHEPITSDRQAVLVGNRIVEFLDAPEGTPEYDERMTLEALVLTRTALQRLVRTVDQTVGVRTH